MLTASNLFGSWCLRSFVIERADGTVDSWGRDAHGLLIYSPDGAMSVSINSSPKDIDAANYKAVFDSVLFYAGTYQLREGGIIVHHVTEATSLQRIGKEMVRLAKLIGEDTLEITGSGEFGTAKLQWQRRRNV